ncbi:MAG: glycosyltransferase family 2 protein [Microgenomates group bacterium]
MLSLAIATYNEENTIVDCLESCKGLVDEIVIVDGTSSDKTAELARGMGARVIVTNNDPMFHINKQKAIDACAGEWILQLDADERVTPELAGEIKQILQMTQREIEEYENKLAEKNLFKRHQSIVQPNWHKQTGEYSAFFIPRLNFFLGGYLRSGGVYPDGVIRLIKKGKASLPCKDVHELMEVDGKTGWLAHPLIHKDSPTFKRYLERNSRYIDRLVADLHVRNKKSQIEMIDWVIVKPIATFFSLTIRHKGIRDGWRGVVFAFFSAIRFARAYYRFSNGSLGKLK